MKIQTVNQLISVFKDISTRHYQINGFGIGDNWENGTSEKMHPVLWINPTTATMPSTDNGYKTFEIDFEVRVFDLVNKDESNENEVLSDCIDILKDIITEFKGHPYYVNSQLNIIDDINFEAFTEEFDEEVSGWVCEISLMTPVLTSFCGIPSAEITGFEFPDYITYEDRKIYFTEDLIAWIKNNNIKSQNDNKRYVYRNPFEKASDNKPKTIFDNIRNWAKVRDIYKKGNSHTQYVKLQEECGELAKAILKKDKPEIVDAIGDIVVVLTNLAHFEDCTIEDCVESAYKVISERKGKMINGTFVKD